jgi:hypothetical protein
MSEPVKKRRCAARARAIVIRSSMAAAGLHQASKLKRAEVLCDCLLRNAAMFDQRAHGQLASAGQALEDRASRRISKGFEDAVGSPIQPTSRCQERFRQVLGSSNNRAKKDVENRALHVGARGTHLTRKRNAANTQMWRDHNVNKIWRLTRTRLSIDVLRRVGKDACAEWSMSARPDRGHT